MGYETRRLQLPFKGLYQAMAKSRRRDASLRVGQPFCSPNIWLLILKATVHTAYIFLGGCYF